VPTPLQYPLERSRALQQRWARLLQRTAVTRPSVNEPHGVVVIASIQPADNRLAELMKLFGCTDEIAPVDADALGRKASEVIWRGVSTPRVSH
jgi:hypothetical protein